MSIIQDIDDILSGKPKGYFRIQTVNGNTVITIKRNKQPEQTIFCLSPGHANQVRQRLSDEGLCGMVEGAW